MKPLVMIAVLLSTLTGAAAAIDGDQVVPGVDADFETLMASVLPRAKRQLRAYGGFLPFGGILMSDGKVGLIVGAKPESARSNRELGPPADSRRGLDVHS